MDTDREHPSHENENTYIKPHFPTSDQPETDAGSDRRSETPGQSLPGLQAERRNGRIFVYSADARLSEARDGETASMYSPGICVNMPESPRRKNDAAPGHETRKRSPDALFKAVCLVLICAVISAATTYGVVEYRILRGDFPPVGYAAYGGAQAQQYSDVTSAAAVPGKEMSAEDIYNMACHQVVGISTGNVSTRRLFEQFGSAAANGSGLIISGEGHILTNFHVVENAYRNDLPITVYLEDGTTYEAEVIGYESANDIAVIKIEAYGLSAAAIGESDGIRVGQRVYAVGNPFGTLVSTITEGIVSALDRGVRVEGKIINTFQHSAAVNPGNSGGPVYNANGEVIGIVTAKFRDPDIEGVGFAIPINDAIGLALSLIEHGYITGRPFIGITPETVTRGNAEFFGLVEGVYVSDVVPGSAAEDAGILFGDVIIMLGKDEIKSREDLEFALMKYKAGDKAAITVWRDGEEVILSITFDELQQSR